MTAIGVGLIGLGNSGWFYHAEGTLERSSEFDLVAVSGRTAGRTAAAGERFGATPYTSWRDLLDDHRVDVVVVATPHDLHAEMAIAALEAGKHVVVEKPMSATSAEADAMLAAADRTGRILTVFHNRRWEPSFQIIQEIVDSGELGDVWRVEERRMHRGKYTVSGADRPHAGAELAAWAHTREGGGGVTNLIAPHLVDHQLRLHRTRPTTVSAVMHTMPGDSVEHYLDLQFHFPGERLSRIEVFREDRVPLPKWSVFGEHGTVVCPDFDTLLVEFADGRNRRHAGLAPLQACNEFYDGLAAAIREDAPPPVSPAEARDVVRVLELAHQSAAAGGVVRDFSRSLETEAPPDCWRA